MKTCTKCKTIKELPEFSKNKADSSGYQLWCRECFKENYQQNREKRDKKARKYYAKTRCLRNKRRREHYKLNQQRITLYQKQYYARTKEKKQKNQEINT